MRGVQDIKIFREKQLKSMPIAIKRRRKKKPNKQIKM